MKYKIGIFGSAEGDLEKILDKAHALGEVLATKELILITGASTGLPYEVIKVAHTNGLEVWGYSKGTDFSRQQELNPTIDSSIFDKIFYVPKGYEFSSNSDVCMKYRNVTSTASCDAGIIISGRWGTMNEFTNLYDMGKVIGILTGTGGIADELESLMKKISKPSKAKIFFSSSPKKLVDEVLKELDNREQR